MNQVSTSRYTPVSMALHWVMAVGILGAFSLGLYMSDLPLSPAKLRYYSWHKWTGVTLFLLALFRLLWRVTHRPPAPPVHMPRWQAMAAAGAHHALYLLMFVIPISGWLMSSAKGFQTVWFGIVPLPDLLAKDKELGDLLKEIHELLNYLMIAIVAAHAGAALKHHFIEKDDVLKRMLPFTKI